MVVRKYRVVTIDAPAVLVESVQIHSDPRQSPFWIKAMGLLRWGGQTPGPWLIGAPENRRCPTRVQVNHAGRGGWGRGPSLVQAPATLPDRAVGSQIAGSAPNRRRPTPYWLDGRGVSVTIVAPKRVLGDAPATNQFWRLFANPFPGLPTHRPFTVQAKARSTSKSVPSRSM